MPNRLHALPPHLLLLNLAWNASRHRELQYLDLRDFGLNVLVEAEK